MEKHQYGSVLAVSIVASLGVVAFVSCMAAETKRIKVDEVKMVGRLYKLPESHAFVFGVAALIFLIVAQVIGNLVAICNFVGLTAEKKGSSSKLTKQLPAVFIALMFISWVSFFMTVILLSTASSMSRKQSYGEGWLDGEMLPCQTRNLYCFRSAGPDRCWFHTRLSDLNYEKSRVEMVSKEESEVKV